MRITNRNLALRIATIISLIGCLAILTSRATYPMSETTQDVTPLVELERPTYFINPAGEPIQVPAGEYEVGAQQGNLQLTGEATAKPILLEALTANHEETVSTAFPLTFSEQEDEVVLILLLPDGTALELVGSHTGILSRAARQSRLPVPSATIKRQLNRARLASRVPRAIPFDFTLRVPVQVSNLSPDINQVKIRCWAHSGQDATKFDRRIGEGESIASVSHRQYQGTVTVRFNASSGKEAQDADRYYCGMLFHKPGIGFRQPAKFGSVFANQKPDWLVSAENTSFRIHAQGGVQ